MILAFSLLSAAVVLGAMALMPGSRRSAIVSRGRLSATHGLLGALAFAALLTSISAKGTQAGWTAVGLLGFGLILGIIIWLATRHKQAPPTLVLALHITIAGMGYLLVAGLFLS